MMKITQSCMFTGLLRGGEFYYGSAGGVKTVRGKWMFLQGLPTGWEFC